MFFSKKVSQKNVCIIFTSKAIYAYILGFDNKKLKLFAHEIYTYINSYTTSYLYNLSEVTQFISSFLKKNNCLKMPLFFGIHGTPLHEKIIVQQSKTPNKSVFASQNTHLVGWQYIYTNENNLNAFYIWSVPHTLIFQYQIITKQLQQRTYAIVPHNAALFQTYKYWYGNAYRTLQLATDLEKHNFEISNFFSPESCYRLIECNNCTPQDPTKQIYLLHAIGIINSYKGMV